MYVVLRTLQLTTALGEILGSVPEGEHQLKSEDGETLARTGRVSRNSSLLGIQTEIYDVT